MQLAEKIRQIIKDRRGVSFPLVIGVTLALVILLCGLSAVSYTHLDVYKRQLRFWILEKTIRRG